MLQIILIIALVLEIAAYIFLAFKWWEAPISLLYIVPLLLCIVVVLRVLMWEG